MTTLRERLGMALIGDQIDELVSDLAQQNRDNVTMMEERLVELELALEDRGWLRMSGVGDTNFSRAGLQTITELARVYWLKNPLVKRAVATQTQYVFGQGIHIMARHPLVNEVIQAFLDDPKNKAELSSQQAMEIKETELQCFANIFFVFFVQPDNGVVRVRTIPFNEIETVITDPEDAKSPWYYKRVWYMQAFDPQSGQIQGEQRTAYYPDWRYRPAGGDRLTAIGGKPVYWDNPVHHVKVNALSDMMFGVSEVYAAFDWAKAYKEFLENWATIVRAYARFAFDLRVQGGATGVAAARSRLASTISTSSGETNPPPVVGSTFLRGSDDVSLTPIRTAGATTSADGGRRLLLMVSAATGIYEHYFGDPSTGNLATAKSMARPMELMFRARQQLWADELLAILQFVIDQAAKAPRGKLQGQEIENDYGELEIVLGLDVDNEDPMLAIEPIDRHVDVHFPPILEADVTERVNAIVQATTLGGQGMPAGTFPDLKFVTRLLLQALGEDNIDEIMADMFPENEDGDNDETAEEQFATALGGLRDLVVSLAERENGS